MLETLPSGTALLLINYDAWIVRDEPHRTQITNRQTFAAISSLVERLN